MTDKAKLYAVKNDKGEWLGWEVYQDDPEFICGGGSVWTDLDKAKFYAKANGGHVVELVDAPAKVVVSEEEAEMLERAKVVAFPAHIFDSGAASCLRCLPGSQDRLMRAYVIGWTVENPKRYVLPMPSGNPDEKSMRFAKRLGPQNWQPSEYRHTVREVSGLVSFLVTQSDINMAPDWVKAIKPVEVTDDEND